MRIWRKSKRRSRSAWKGESFYPAAPVREDAEPEHDPVFFEDTLDEVTNEAHRRLFDGLKIMQCEEEVTGLQCGFPVISLTLKSVKQGTFDVAYGCLAQAIAWEFDRHSYLLDALKEDQRETFLRIRGEKASRKEMGTALAFLSKCLYAYHRKKVIVLIDEYDVPLENSISVLSRRKWKRWWNIMECRNRWKF